MQQSWPAESLISASANSDGTIRDSHFCSHFFAKICRCCYALTTMVIATGRFRLKAAANLSTEVHPDALRHRGRPALERSRCASYLVVVSIFIAIELDPDLPLDVTMASGLPPEVVLLDEPQRYNATIASGVTHRQVFAKKCEQK